MSDVGSLVAATGSLRVGTLVFASAGAISGAGKLLAADGDRAASFAILVVGVLSVLGVVGRLLTGL